MQLVDKIMSEETGFATVRCQDEAALLVNNMGTTPPIEMYLVANAAVRYLTSVKQACLVLRCWPVVLLLPLWHQPDCTYAIPVL